MRALQLKSKDHPKISRATWAFVSVKASGLHVAKDRLLTRVRRFAVCGMQALSVVSRSEWPRIDWGSFMHAIPDAQRRADERVAGGRRSQIGGMTEKLENRQVVRIQGVSLKKW